MNATASLLAVSTACAHGGAISERERRLAGLKAEVMSADYRADLAALARLREEVLQLADAPGLSDLAHYWSGYSSWRLAINGVNSRMSSQDLKANLRRAVAEFEAAIQQNDALADGYAAAASALGWLAVLDNDRPAMLEDRARSSRLLARARTLAPDNPRVLWVVGGVYLFSPPEYGGSKERAIEIYRRMAQLAEAVGTTSSPLPDWGRPEALMSLAYAHLHQVPPNLECAAGEARAALRLQPEWSYVRDILLPQIEAGRGRKSEERPLLPGANGAFSCE